MLAVYEHDYINQVEFKHTSNPVLRSVLRHNHVVIIVLRIVLYVSVAVVEILTLIGIWVSLRLSYNLSFSLCFDLDKFRVVGRYLMTLLSYTSRSFAFSRIIQTIALLISLALSSILHSCLVFTLVFSLHLTDCVFLFEVTWTIVVLGSRLVEERFN